MWELTEGFQTFLGRSYPPCSYYLDDAYLNRLPHEMTCISVLGVGNAGVVELDWVFQVDAAFRLNNLAGYVGLP
jgi:hypothetical protein